MPLVTISGPSGAGKSTILNYVNFNFNAKFIPSWTTRPQRLNSVAEDIYIQIPKEDFLIKLESGFFLTSDKIANNYYGTANSDIERALSSSDLWIADLSAKTVLDMVASGCCPDLTIVVMISKEMSSSRMKTRGDNIADISQRLDRYCEETINCRALVSKSIDTVYINGEESITTVELTIATALKQNHLII